MSEVRIGMGFHEPVPMPSTPALGMVEAYGGLRLQLVSPRNWEAIVAVKKDGDCDEPLSAAFETEVEEFSELMVVKEGERVEVWLDWELHDAIRNPERFPDPETPMGELLGTVTITGRIDGLGRRVEILREHRARVIMTDDGSDRPVTIFEDGGWMVTNNEIIRVKARVERDVLVRDIEFEGINWVIGHGSAPELLIYENGIAAKWEGRSYIVMAFSPAEVEEIP